MYDRFCPQSSVSVVPVVTHVACPMCVACSMLSLLSPIWHVPRCKEGEHVPCCLVCFSIMLWSGVQCRAVSCIIHICVCPAVGVKVRRYPTAFRECTCMTYSYSTSVNIHWQHTCYEQCKEVGVCVCIPHVLACFSTFCLSRRIPCVYHSIRACMHRM